MQSENAIRWHTSNKYNDLNPWPQDDFQTEYDLDDSPAFAELISADAFSSEEQNEQQTKSQKNNL